MTRWGGGEVWSLEERLTHTLTLDEDARAAAARYIVHRHPEDAGVLLDALDLVFPDEPVTAPAPEPPAGPPSPPRGRLGYPFLLINLPLSIARGWWER